MHSTASYPEVNVGPDSVLIIVSSSGSSGLPKGVQLTHRNILTQVTSLRPTTTGNHRHGRLTGDRPVHHAATSTLPHRLTAQPPQKRPEDQCQPNWESQLPGGRSHQDVPGLCGHPDGLCSLKATAQHAENPEPRQTGGARTMLERPPGMKRLADSLLSITTNDQRGGAQGDAVRTTGLQEQATTLLLYPTLTLKLNQHPLLGEFDTSSLTKLLVAGGTVTGHLLQSITKKLNLKGITQVYGMTELTGAVTLSTPNLIDIKSVGKPAAFMEMKEVDPETRESLGPLQHGEICVRGPSAFKGYVGRPEETAALYEDGFIMTGDTGYYSADGLFYVSGRIKELIKCMDQQVAPAELEELLAADPGVRQVVVAGVPHPQLGEAARAFVVPSQRLQGPSEEQQEANRLKELVAVNLAIHKHLHGGVEFLERIPHTESGKDLRRALKDAYLEQQGGD
ncbi:luciferin 4-monooxygenase-like [Rhipicephalus sanguineus]|uniref:luciferin 4-monooxygenase-like n=1 Tax=Rhipicephalus sanguineus TaxID=34632 RepID=UPI0018942985|nr:luciferin 4-monooxygenase-like [Rhipicephalus sanguineus]